MTTTGIRAEVVGSLLRPAYLKKAVARRDAGELDDHELREVQDRAVREGIELQEACGIEVVTDGEMRRAAWTDPLTSGFGGFERSEAIGLFAGAGRQPSALPALTGTVSLVRNIPLEEAIFAREHASRPVKPVLPSPSYASVLYAPGVSDEAYATREDFLADLLPLMRDLVGGLVDAGFDTIQLDCPRYSTLVMAETRERMRGLGIEPETWLGDMIALDNELMDGFPDVTWGMHVCRGNHASTWYAEGGYDPIAEQLFADLHVQRLFLEYDTPRSGTFEPLRFLAPDKTAVLGLLTTKEPQLEPDEDLIRRIEEAAQFVPLDRLALSPQCGFASTFPGNLVDEDVQRAKLETVGRVARRVWG